MDDDSWDRNTASCTFTIRYNIITLIPRDGWVTAAVLPVHLLSSSHTALSSVALPSKSPIIPISMNFLSNLTRSMSISSWSVLAISRILFAWNDYMQSKNVSVSIQVKVKKKDKCTLLFDLLMKCCLFLLQTAVCGLQALEELSYFYLIMQ